MAIGPTSYHGLVGMMKEVASSIKVAVKGGTAIIYSNITMYPQQHEPMVCSALQRYERLEFQWRQRQLEQQQLHECLNGSGGLEFTA